MSLLIAVALLFGTPTEARASIITIDVASLVWTVEGDDCTSETSAACLSVFTLNYLWLDGVDPGPGPAPTDVSAALSTSLGDDTLVTALSTSTSFVGLPLSTAAGTVSFNFLGPQSIGPLNFATNGVGVLFETDGTPSLLGIAIPYQFQYDDSPVPVPEPSTLGLLALGLIAVRRRLRR